MRMSEDFSTDSAAECSRCQSEYAMNLAKAELFKTLNDCVKKITEVLVQELEKRSR